MKQTALYEMFEIEIPGDQPGSGGERLCQFPAVGGRKDRGIGFSQKGGSFRRAVSAPERGGVEI